MSEHLSFDIDYAFEPTRNWSKSVVVDIPSSGDINRDSVGAWEIVKVFYNKLNQPVIRAKLIEKNRASMFKIDEQLVFQLHFVKLIYTYIDHDAEIEKLLKQGEKFYAKNDIR